MTEKAVQPEQLLEEACLQDYDNVKQKQALPCETAQLWTMHQMESIILALESFTTTAKNTVDASMPLSQVLWVQLKKHWKEDHMVDAVNRRTRHQSLDGAQCMHENNWK